MGDQQQSSDSIPSSMDEGAILKLVQEHFDGLIAEDAQFFQNDGAPMTPPTAGAQRVVSSDMIVEDIDFSLRLAQTAYPDQAFFAGHRAMMQNLSDLASMGAMPVGFVWSLALPGRWLESEQSILRSFLKGAAHGCAENGLQLYGGDLSGTLGPMVGSVTVWGDVSGIPLSRTGAKPGHEIWISGPLGASAHGLALLQKGDGEKHPAIDRHLSGQCRLELGAALVGKASACIDVSDGFARDLHRICRASQVGAKLPHIDRLVDPMAGKGQEALQRALYGGEDYELIFTLEPGRMAPQTMEGAIQIGFIEESCSILYPDRNGIHTELADRGYDHFAVESSENLQPKSKKT
jgi:thiamine-monophosphate kinase